MSKPLVVEEVYTQIKSRILSGQYLPGVHLVEATLTEELQVSRVTLREALRRLVADELVDLVPNSGIRVRQLTQKETHELFVVRNRLETLAAKLAAESPNKNLNVLRKNLEEFKAVSKHNLMQFRMLNDAYHTKLVESSGNQVLINILARLRIQISGQQLQNLQYLKDDDIQHSYKEHKAIFEAISANDAEKAELAMQNHLDSALRFALSAFQN